jgi:uncharacterized OB-fold protein
MFKCDRCGSGFSPIRVASNEYCPRCRARDGVSAPLSFAPFAATTAEVDDAPSSGTEEASPDEEAEEAR